MNKKFLALAAVAAFCFDVASAFAFEPRVGRDYREILSSQKPLTEADKIEVIQFFKFNCKSCFRLNRRLQKWKEKQADDDVDVFLYPAMRGRKHVHFARVYYVIDALGEKEEHVHGIFNAIHNEGARLDDKSRFLGWLQKQGGDREKAEAIYGSPDVFKYLADAESIAEGYGINVVTSVAVAGKYIVDIKMSGTTKKMMKTVDALVEHERKARAGRS